MIHSDTIVSLIERFRRSSAEKSPIQEALIHGAFKDRLEEKLSLDRDALHAAIQELKDLVLSDNQVNELEKLINLGQSLSERQVPVLEMRQPINDILERLASNVRSRVPRSHLGLRLSENIFVIERLWQDVPILQEYLIRTQTSVKITPTPPLIFPFYPYDIKQVQLTERGLEIYIENHGFRGYEKFPQSAQGLLHDKKFKGVVREFAKMKPADIFKKIAKSL